MKQSKAARRPPSLFDYEDYRVFLRDHFRFRKAGVHRYSFGIFARRAGIPSRSHPKLVMDGQRNLGPDMVEKYVKGLGLTGSDSAGFRALVRRTQARSDAERQAAEAEWKRVRFQRETRMLGLGEAEGFLRRWDAALILSMTMLSGFRRDPRWISRRSRGRISEKSAREALGWLVRDGHLKARRRRGARGESVSAREFPEMSPELEKRMTSWFFRELASSPRPPGFGETTFMLTVLTPPEAEELTRRFWRWLNENVPDHSRHRVDGELCVIVGDILPLTLRRGRPIS